MHDLERAPPNVDDLQAHVDTLQHLLALLLRRLPPAAGGAVLDELEWWGERQWEQPGRCAIMLDVVADLRVTLG